MFFSYSLLAAYMCPLALRHASVSSQIVTHELLEYYSYRTLCHGAVTSVSDPRDRHYMNTFYLISRACNALP